MPKSEQGFETRSRILDSGRQLFAANGYQATGVAEICQAAGVSKGAFYHHFPSKQSVLETIFQEWLRGLEPALDLWRDDRRPVPALLASTARAARPAFIGDENSRRLLLELWSQTTHDQDLAQVALAPHRRYQDGLKAILDRGVREGSLRRHNTSTGARVLISLAVGALLQSLLAPASDDWANVVTEGVALLLRGMLKER